MAAASPQAPALAGPPALRRKEAVCGPPNAGQATKAWNEWLDERDRAPGEILGDWFKEKFQEGVEVAKGYAKAGIDIAKNRAEVVQKGRALLDDGGEPAREAIRMKQHVSRAVGCDQSIVQALRYYSKSYQEDAAFQADPQAKSLAAERATAFMRALEALGDPPADLPMTPVERDAAALMRWGQAAAGIGRPLSLGGPDRLALPGVGGAAGGYPGSAAATAGQHRMSSDQVHQQNELFEKLLKELFRLHDLDGNGSIEEPELVKLNQKIAMLHYGKGADKEAVRQKFSAMFRENLDKDGKPVEFPVFRAYTLKMLNELDPSRPAQEMILEQFIAEAQSARAAFHCASFASVSDAEYLAHLADDKPAAFMSLTSIAESPSETVSTVATPSRDSHTTASAGSGSISTQNASSVGTPTPTMADRIAADAARASPGILRSRTEQPRQPGPHGSQASAPPTAAHGSTKVERQPSTMSHDAAAFGRSDSRASSGKVDRHPSVSTQDAHSSMGTLGSSAASVARDDEAPAAAAAEKAALREKERQASGGYASKDRIQVYSNSKGEWLDGVVLQVFPQKCEAEGYSVPAGTLKVQSAAGVKWIRPGQATAALRKKPDAAEH